MAAIRRAPKPPPRKPVKIVKPIHQRILGRGAVEVDTLADLESELERALELDLIEWDNYLDCREALDIRKAKARTAIDKATGRYVKPDRVVNIRARPVGKGPPRRHKTKWHVKLLIVFCILLVWKVFSFKP